MSAARRLPSKPMRLASNISTCRKSSVMPASRAARFLRRRSAISRKACSFACRFFWMSCRLSRRAPISRPRSPSHYAEKRLSSKSLPAEASGRIEPQSLNGTNDLELRVFANDVRGHAILVAKLDNLGKGASGAAMQNLKLMLHAA